MSSGDAPRYSIVVPLHDEEQNVALLVARLRAVLDRLDGPWEVILVDDGSRDATAAAAIREHQQDGRVKLVRLSRNFGHQIALSAGLDLARGQAVITMDGDLQHPPEVIPAFVETWRAGNEVVVGLMAERAGESRFKDASARWFYRILGKLSSIEMTPAAGDFRLVDRKALEALRAMPEGNRYLRGMFSWIGFSHAYVPYASPPRVAGRSKYTTRKMLSLATNAIVGFSDRPLRIALDIGFAVSLLSILFGISALATKLAGGFSVPGWASIMVLVGFVGGFQLMVIGVIGEYVARIHDEVKRRPLYLVRDAYGIDVETAPPRWR